MSEYELIIAAKAGDRDAAGALIEMHEGMIHKLAHKYAMGRDIEDDMMQAGRFGMLKAIRLFDPSRGFKFLTYASKAAMSEMIVVGEKYDRVGAANPEETNLDWMEAPHERDDRDLDGAVKAITKLADRERDILLSRFNGETRRGISERIGLSKERVRQIEQAAIGQVRRLLGIAAMVVLMILPGCSATEAIGTAARDAQVSAAAGTSKLSSGDAKLGTAIATGDVGPKAKPLVDSARADIGAAKQEFAKINDLASGIQDRVDNGEIKDTKGWLAKLIDVVLWVLGGGAFIFVLVYFSGWFKPLIQITGSFLNLIPKAIRLDAESDAKYIAEVKKVGHPASEDAIRAIELKKLDARYKKVFDKNLNALGVPT